VKQKLEPFYFGDPPVRWDHFFYDTRSRIMYFMKSHAGKKIKFSCLVTTDEPMKAKRYANLEFDKRTGRKTKHARRLIKDYLSSWEALKESEGLKYDTMNNVRRARKQIEEFWGDKLPSAITRDSFAEWILFWRSEHPEIEMENAIKYFNNFCVYLHEQIENGQSVFPARLRFKDPNRKKIKARRARKKERVLTHDEFKKIYSTAENEVEALVVLIMYTMATRIDETLKLDFGRILLDEEVPLYRWTADTNKAEKIGEHALHPSLIEPLKKLRAQRMREGTFLLFPQKNDNQKALREQMIGWDEWRKRADIGWHWTPHTFKHTCLTNLFNDPSLPQLIICQLYRTSLQVALEVYVKPTRESRMRFRDAIKVAV
jgi:integrase